MTLLLSLVIIFLLGCTIYSWFRVYQEKQERERLDTLVISLLDKAWDYNDIDHPLATEIRNTVFQTRGQKNA